MCSFFARAGLPLDLRLEHRVAGVGEFGLNDFANWRLH